MTLKNSLRLRGAIAFLLAGSFLSTLFAVGMHFVGHDMELRFIEATLGEQMEHFIEMAESDPTAAPPTTRHMQAFVTPADAEHDLPPYLRGLGPGTYDERIYEGREYHIMIRDRRGKRFYLAYDATFSEPYESLLHGFLIAAAFFFSVLALGLGYWLSGRIIAPVTRLARQVKRLRLDGEHVAPSTEYARDEVGDLAKTFDEYVQRLQAFAQRERQFTSDVSHELRTSVAIMRSTVELLLSEHETSEPTRQRLRRLEEAVRQMGELITVFLILAREPQPLEQEAFEMCAVEPVLRNVLDIRQASLERKGLTIQIAINGKPEVRAPETVLAVALGDLLDNAIAYTEQGGISVTLDAHGVTITDTGVGMSGRVQPHIFERGYRGHKAISDGAGLGLYIVKRLCERYGWKIEVDSTEGEGTQVRLVFVP